MTDVPLPPLHEVELGPAWAGSSVNCKTYATEPMVFARLADGREAVFGAYFNADGDLVCYRWLPRRGALRTVAAAIPRAPSDAHDTASVQIDVRGTVHVVGGAHRNRPFHLLWRDGGDSGALEDESADLPEEVERASYPSLVRVGEGALFLLYRLGLPHRSQWRVTRRTEGGWDNAPRTLVSGVSSSLCSAGPYPNQPLIYADGRVGLVFCWRSISVERGRADPMNVGLDYVEFSDNFTVARTGDGIRLSMPVAPGNFERILPIRWGADLTNQSGSSVLSSGAPAFAAAWREPGEVRQIRFCWRDSAGRWSSRAVTRFSDDHVMKGGGTLPAPYSRPAVVPAPDGRAIVLYRDGMAGGRLVAQLLTPPDFDPVFHPPVTLIDGGLDQYEPVAERLGSVSSGMLVCYVQRAEQVVGGDQKLRRTSAPARLMTWDIRLGRC